MNGIRSSFYKEGELSEYDAYDYGGDFVVDNSNQIKSATDNNGMFSTENADIRMAIQKPDYIEIEDEKEVEILRHDLFNKFKEKSSYGCVGHTANYWYLCDYFGDSNYKIKAQIQIDGNEKFLNDIERKLGNRTYRDAESFVRRIAALASGEGQYYYGNVDVKILRGETAKNAVLDSSKIENEENPFSTSSDGQSITDNAGTGLTISTEDDWIKDAGFFQTPDGTIYGFADPQGNIYLDETIISPEHPIHEYTHLWDRIIAERNPELWKRGIELMKDPNHKFKNHDKTIWQEVEEDANYGPKWQHLKEDDSSKYEENFFLRNGVVSRKTTIFAKSFL
jgi:hypothetical protein